MREVLRCAIDRLHLSDLSLVHNCVTEFSSTAFFDIVHYVILVLT